MLDMLYKQEIKRQERCLSHASHKYPVRDFG